MLFYMTTKTDTPVESKPLSAAHAMLEKGASPLQMDILIEGPVIDIAKAAVFLASSNAITGTTLYVDGGQHLLPSSRDVMFKTN